MDESCRVQAQPRCIKIAQQLLLLRCGLSFGGHIILLIPAILVIHTFFIAFSYNENENKEKDEKLFII